MNRPSRTTSSRNPRFLGWVGGVLLPIAPLAAVAWLGGVAAWTARRHRPPSTADGTPPRRAWGSILRTAALVWGPALVVGIGYAVAGDGAWLAWVAVGGIVVTGGLEVVRTWGSRGVLQGVATGLIALSIVGLGHLTWERIAWNDAPTATSTPTLWGAVPSVRVDGHDGALAGAATWGVPDDASAMPFALHVETQRTPSDSVTTANPMGSEAGSERDAETPTTAYVEVVWRDRADRNLDRRVVAPLSLDGSTFVDESLIPPLDGEPRWIRVLLWLPPTVSATVVDVRMSAVTEDGDVLGVERRAPSRWSVGAGHPNLAGHGWALLALSATAASRTPAGVLAASVGGLALVLLSGSRAALAVFLVALPALVWLRRRHARRRGAGGAIPQQPGSASRPTVLVATIGIAALASAGLWFASDLGRDVALTDLTRRPDAVRVALAAIAEHPGAGPTTPFADLYCAAVPDGAACLTHPHALLLEAGVRHGLPGLLSAGWIFVALAGVAIARRDGALTVLVASAFVLNLADPSLLEPTLLAGLGIGMALPPPAGAARAARATFQDGP